MNTLICPKIFGDSVKAFFTEKSVGADAENISRLLSIRTENIYIPIQKHTDGVLILDDDFTPKIADAVVTRRRGILIGVQVADCVPVLLYDRKKSVIGVVHAGWRGTAAQIVKKTIAVMIKKFKSLQDDIIIALGPCIRGGCYQVDFEVKDSVCRATGDGEYCIRKGKKYFIDLGSANMIQAMSLGIPGGNIWLSSDCTHCNPDRYHSFRYSKQYNGSQGGFIGIL